MPRRPVLLLTALLLALVATLTGATHAQDGPRPVAEQPAPAPQSRIDAWRAEIEAIAAGLKRDGLSDRELDGIRAAAEGTRDKAAGLAQEIAPRLAAARARLNELGPAPVAKPGEPPPPPEPEALRAEREAQGKAAADLEGLIKQAEVIRLAAEEVIRTTADRRRAQFAQILTERTRSLVDPRLWIEAGQALPRVSHSARLLVADWWNLILSRGGPTALAAIVLALGFALLMLVPVRRVLIARTERSPDNTAPVLLTQAAAAAGVAVLHAVVPFLGLMALYVVLDAFALAPQRIEATFRALIVAGVLATGLYGVARGLLAPGRPHWRLVNLDNDQAASVTSLVLAMAIVSGLGRFLEALLNVLAAPLATIIAFSGLVAVLTALGAMAILRVIARAPPSAADETTPKVERRLGAWRWLAPVAWVATLTVIVAALLGYVGLARFLGRQIVWWAIVLGALAILLPLVDELITAAFRSGSRIATVLGRALGFSEQRVEQAGELFSGLARLLLIGFAAFLIATPWGFNSSDIAGSLSTAFFGFQVGGLSFSLSTIIGALAFFVIGLLLTRGVQSWLDHRFLPRTSLDVGLKNSIRTGMGYLGVTVAAVMAVGFAGVDLNKVAIVAGALSVGIGFGLQSIVNNFVSGLILLAERPIKAGDRVNVSGEVGYVRKINVRSTEIETLDRASLIVPNSALISGTVKNWMHRDLTGQAIVDVGVYYDADPERVRQILLECARGHPHVLRSPEPVVFFTAFGENSLDFRLIATVGHVDRAFAAQSDLRFAIMKRLREEAIEIPYAQRDLHITNVEEIARAVALATREGGAGRSAPAAG